MWYGLRDKERGQLPGVDLPVPGLALAAAGLMVVSHGAEKKEPPCAESETHDGGHPGGDWILEKGQTTPQAVKPCAHGPVTTRALLANAVNQVDAVN